jgi:hypothetical protein
LKCFGLTVLASLICLTSPALALDCKSLGATYALDGDDPKEFTLRFQAAKEVSAYSDLDVVLKTPNGDFRLAMTASNGYSFNYAFLVDPKPVEEEGQQSTSEFHLYLFDKDMKMASLPQSSASAPPMIFLPELGSYLWYGLGEKQQFLPVGMWRLTSCK